MSDINEIYKLTLERKLVYLIENLTIDKGSQLINILNAKGILTGPQVEEIKEQGTRYRMATTLMEFMIKKPHKLTEFAQALHEDGQTRVAEEIADYVNSAREELAKREQRRQQDANRFGGN